MFECALWKSPTSCFRSAICGLSTAASVIVVPLPPPPPPAPGEHAAPSRATSSPRMVMALCRTENRSFLSLMQSHLFSFGQIGMPPGSVTTLSKDNVV